MPLYLKHRYDVHSANHVGRVVCFSLDVRMYLLSKNGPVISTLRFCFRRSSWHCILYVCNYTIVVLMMLSRQAVQITLSAAAACSRRSSSAVLLQTVVVVVIIPSVTQNEISIP